jgi:predicted ATPase
MRKFLNMNPHSISRRFGPFGSSENDRFGMGSSLWTTIRSYGGVSAGADYSRVNPTLATTRRRCDASRVIAPPQRRGNLRPPATSLVGRQHDLDALLTRVASGEPCVTLTGPGGIGKTRIAIELALRWAATPGAPTRNAWFCDLSAARDLDSAIGDIASTLGVPIGRCSPDDAIDRLGSALAARTPCLVVLDNAEQIIDAVARIADRWLRGSGPDVFVVTSRERLRVAGESVVEVPPLGVEPGTKGATSEATHLLIDRVASARGRYAPSPAELEQMDKLVRRLEGLPLAIELSARRVAALGPAALNASPAMLDAEGSRNAPTRQNTLRDTFDWSWRGLDDDERSALAQCSVFRGGFEASAAAVVVRTRTERSIDALLISLREKSLLREVTSSAAANVRFGYYAPLLEFASEKLAASDDASGARARHAAWCAALAESLSRSRRGPGHAASMSRLFAEIPNFRDALERGLAMDATVESFRLAADLAMSLEPAMRERGSYGWVLDVAERLLDSPRAHELGAVTLARLHAARGSARQMAGRSEEVSADLEAALAIATKLGDLRLELDVMTRWNHHAGSIGDSSTMARTASRAIALADATGERHGQSELLGRLAVAACARNDVDDALRNADLAIAIARTGGDAAEQASAEQVAGYCHFDAGSLAAAREHFTRARALARDARATLIEGIALGNLGSLAVERGDDEGAVATFGEAIATLEAVGADRPAATARAYRSLVAFQRRRFAECYAQLVAAWERLGGAERTVGNAFFSGWLGLCEFALGRHEQGTSRVARVRDAWGTKDNTLGVVVHVQAALLDAFDAERRAALGDGPGAREAEARAVAALASRFPAGARVPPEDVRVALRVAQRATDSGALRRAIAAIFGEQPPVTVAHDGSWFRATGGAEIDCTRNGPAQRALVALARARVATPGRVVSSRELIASVWPNEKILERAAANRLRVALATLRSSGARDWLVTRETGYLIDPGVPVDVIERESARTASPKTVSRRRPKAKRA